MNATTIDRTASGTTHGTTPHTLRRSLQVLRRTLALGLAALPLAAAALPTLWVGDADGTLARVDLGTGQVSLVGTMAAVMTDIAFTAEGQLYGVDGSSQLWRINPANGASTWVGSLGRSVNSLVFDAQGTLYAASDRLLRVDTRTGTATELGGAGSGYLSSGDLAFVGGSLYLSSLWPQADTLFRIDPGSGAGQAVGSGLGVRAVYGLATDDNVHLYGLAGRSVVRIDPQRGTATHLVDYSGLAPAWGTAFASEAVAAVGLPQGLATAPVPEPPSALLALAGLWWMARRLRGAAAQRQVPPT